MRPSPWKLLALVNSFFMAVITIILVLKPVPEEDMSADVVFRVVDCAPDRPRGTIYIPSRYRDSLLYWCEQAGVPFDIMARVAHEESAWNPDATNGKDHGMFQLNGEFLEYYSWKFNDGVPIDPFDAETSIKVACRYMAFLYGLCGDYRIAVAAYNAGYTRVKDRGLPPSTKEYLSRVFGYEVAIF